MSEMSSKAVMGGEGDAQRPFVCVNGPKKMGLASHGRVRNAAKN